MNKTENLRLSIILPCLDEEKAVGGCIDRIEDVIRKSGLPAEIIIVDNGSTDRSVAIVKDKIEEKMKRMPVPFPELRLVSEPHRGYGAACLAGFAAARGEYLYMADADGTYDFAEIPAFVARLDEGFDLVVGNRFARPLGKGVMPIHRQYLGNPILSFLVRIFFGVRIHDIHCGARAISKKILDRLSLRTAGMEFASEMIIKAAKAHLRIGELPIAYGLRVGESKLRSFHDGWRHLRFILLYSPLILFLLPGIVLFTIGFLSLILLYFESIRIFGIELFVHPMFLSALLIIVGWQLIVFSMFSKIYAITHLGEKNPFFEKLFQIATLERVALIGGGATLVGLLVYVFILVSWIRSGFGSLDEIKNSIVALVFVVVGIETVFSAFMLSIIGIEEQKL
jgi:glycosyltransferase involved in cell wall biosynthesis